MSTKVNFVGETTNVNLPNLIKGPYGPHNGLIKENKSGHRVPLKVGLAKRLLIPLKWRP